MGKIENLITAGSLERAKDFLVPTIFTKNYYSILKKKLEKNRLSENERYYYNHFIKKKLQGMAELFEIDTTANGKQFIKKDRLQKATGIIKKYSRKHKNMKLLVSGSFLFSNKYRDIDLFVISKYKKEDYTAGQIHVNYLPMDIEKTLFFKSIYAVSIANFKSDTQIDAKFSPNDVLHLYEIVVLLMMQGDKYLQELRDLVLQLEYLSNKVILNTIQLKTITDKIIRTKNSVQAISKYLTAKIISSYKRTVLIKTLKQFIEKNSAPEKGQKLYKNWKIYNQTYQEAMEVVA
jgi:hypothetical protein